MRKLLLMISVFVLLVSAQAKPKAHGGTYLIGTVAEQKAITGTTIEQCLGASCVTVPVSSRITHIKTEHGVYTLAQPYTIPWNRPIEYIPWFVTDLHEGDKLLFAASCTSANYCIYWVPDPSNPEKEIRTEGRFHPFNPKSNTRALCGTGKLTPEMEAELCR